MLVLVDTLTLKYLKYAYPGEGDGFLVGLLGVAPINARLGRAGVAEGLEQNQETGLGPVSAVVGFHGSQPEPRPQSLASCGPPRPH